MSVSRRSFLRGMAGGLIGSTVAGAWGDIGSRHVRLDRVELRLKGWKADGLRIGFFSDIHVNEYGEMMRAKRAAEMLAAEPLDLLCFGGDAVNFNADVSMDYISESLAPFDGLKCPKLAILGNHDYWTGAVHKVEKRLDGAGFRILKNEVAEFENYAVAGYDDRMSGKIDKTFQPGHESLLVLMHEPDHVEFVPKTACLQLSGHSHGGQLCLPFGIPVHTPKLSRVYQVGFYPDAHVPIYVSRGVGTTGPKWRTFCPPEVTVLTMRSA